jgi:YbbR domain-containing protein
MKKRVNNPFNNTKLKSFLFFLLLATLFWVLTKFSKHYTATTTARLNYTNIPNLTLLADDNPKQIGFDLSTSGFEFLYFKLKSPEIDIDVARYFEEGQTEVTVPKLELVKLISSHLKTSLDVRNLSPESLRIQLDKIETKRVPVIANVDFTFKDGFKTVDSLVIVPDSVSIAGPSVALDTIYYVETVETSEKGIDKSISRKIAVHGFNDPKISVSPVEVNISLQVAEFSQKKMTLPISVINAPERTVVKLLPNVITIVFNVAMEDFQTITENDFEVVCDYSERNSEENFMVPKIVKSPDDVTNIELEPKKIDFLIFK